MDKTETYIKMADYPEIQNKWIPSIGDIFSHRENGKVETNPIYETTLDWADGKTSLIPVAITWPEWRNRFIWLPHQDQLQEMVVKYRHPTIDEERYCAYYLYLDFYDWLPRHGSILERKGRINCNSMEQLWLAFVMKEKYNKVWNGDEWTSG